MTGKRRLKNEINDLKRTTDDSGNQILFEASDTGTLYDRHKNPTTPQKRGMVLVLPWHMAPFVVEREQAEQEGWSIVEPVVVDDDPRYDEPVEVSEWCVNPWVDDPDKRTVVAE
jgi:hypothetical protein